MRILMLGDIVGRPGRMALEELLPRVREEHRPDLVVANAENAAAGFGLTASVGREILDDFRSYLPKFWLVKPKAADLESLIDSLRRAA